MAPLVLIYYILLAVIYANLLFLVLVLFSVFVISCQIVI